MRGTRLPTNSQNVTRPGHAENSSSIRDYRALVTKILFVARVG